MVSVLIVSLKRQRDLFGSKVSILSPAKINLYLNIIGKYSGRFHRIESVVERISLFDEITITVKKNPSIVFSSSDKDLPIDDNLVVRAAQLLKKRYNIAWGLDIHLEKNIPVGSGLGGGSSNAASTLLAMNALFNLSLNKKELYHLGACLGSDVNFFLSESQFALLEGRGQKVTPLTISNTFSHFIIWPKRSVLTKEIYGSRRAKLTKFFNNVKILQYALLRGDIFLIRKSIFNVLEREVLTVCKELKKVKQYLSQKGIFTRVTGSGSALYTVGISSSLQAFKSIVPSHWAIFQVQTF